MKALLGIELCLENGANGDAVGHNGKTNGFAANCTHKDEEEGEGNMAVQEEAEPMKSPSAPKGKGGRKSKADSETKSESESVDTSHLPGFICLTRRAQL